MAFSDPNATTNESVLVERVPRESQVSTLSQDADLDSLLELPFVAGDTSNSICPHNDGSVLANDEPDPSSSSHDPLPNQQMELETKPKTTRFWNPFWSSPALLFALSIVIALLSAATIGLWRFSVSSHGFPLLTAINYSWTYGPTAVLTLIMSIWNQTTYYCKLLEPWRQLKLGPLGPEQTLLLDYISPILPVTLWRATRLKHIPVLVTVWTGIVLKVVTVASTGLLSPVNTRMSFQNVSLEALSTFNTENLDLHGYSFSSLSESVINYEAYALIANQLNFPDGIQPDLAFQRFRLPENSTANRTLSTIRATVQSFKPSVQCEDANVISVNASTETRHDEALLHVFANISWPSCHSSKRRPRQLKDTFSLMPTKLPPRQIYGGVPYADLICHDSAESFWNFVAIYDIRYNQTAIPSAIFHAELSNSSGTWGIQIVEATSTACRISYSMVPAQVTYDLSRNPVEPVVDLLQDNSTSYLGPFIEGFPELDFSSRIYHGAAESPFMVGSYITNGMDEFAPNTFVDMMSRAGNKTPADFLSSPDAMSSAASTVFTYAGIQVANAFLISDTTEDLQGEISTLTTRLQISSLASLAMVSGLLIAAIGAIVLVSVRAQDVVTHRPGPIGSMAMVLRDSPSFNVLLSNCGESKLEQISRILSTFTFQSIHNGTRTGSTSIVPQPRDSVKKTELLSEEKVTWWRPLPLHPCIFTLISLFSISVIITLEVLQHVSQRTDGITSILTPDSFLVTFGTRFVPSTVFIFIAILYDSIEFNVAMLAAYSRLKAGKAKGKPVITHALLGRFSLESLGFALWNKYWETSFATLAAFLGSFLTIVASGLYTIESLPGPSPVTARRVDRFDPTWSDSVNDDGGAAISLTNFALLNLSFPSWTNSELALPELQLSPEDFAQINSSSEPSFTVQVPAVRGELQCAILSMEDMVVDVPYVDTYGGTLVVNGSTPIPPLCDVGTSTVSWSSRQEIADFHENYSLLGQIIDLHPGDRNFSFGEFTQPLQDNSPPGCPSLAFTFGNYSVQEDLSLTGKGLEAPPTWITTMSCTQLMAEIQTDVTLSIPDFTVISALPDESTAKYLVSGGDGQIAFPWRPQLHFELEVIIWDGNITYGGFGSPSVVQEYDNVNYEVDGFFSLLLHHSNKVNPEDLLGRNRQEQLLNAIQGQYRRYMAQVANKKMRVPIATNTPPEIYTGTWMNTNRGVLRQDRRSKLALQIILAVMFTCGIASYILIDTGEVLPHDPCSIAGLASLLAGSSICEDQEPIDPRISEGREIHGSGWEMQKFSLGWWRLSTGGERFGIDIGSATWK